jgi:hypothetical protein
LKQYLNKWLFLYYNIGENMPTFVLEKENNTVESFPSSEKRKRMKRKLLLSALLCSSMHILLGQNGTRPDNAKVILKSGVVRTINVLANDNAVAGKTYEVVDIYKTTLKDITITHSSPNVTYQDNHHAVQNDTFFYIARDINSGSLDTNYVVIVKDELSQDLYPGDANKDNLCNHIDVLNIGIAYGKNEIMREGKFLTTNWEAVSAYDWTLTNNKSNYRYSDANGDGLVDSAGDVGTVLKNYNRSIGLTNVHYSPTGGESFSIVLPDTIALESNVKAFQFSVHLGTNANKVRKSYGIAFTLKFNQAYINPDKITFKASKWFTDQESTLNFTKVNNGNGELDVVIVRKSGKNSDGEGELGIVDIVEIDVLGGLVDPINTSFEILKPVLIDSTYNVLPITLPAPKSVHVVKKSSSQINIAQQKSGLRYYQNDQILTLKNENSKPLEVSIVSILGKEISKRVLAPNQLIDTDTNLWSSGIYFLKTSGEAYKIHVK